MMHDSSSFLMKCQQSSEEAINCLTSLLENLENENQRPQAIELLLSVIKQLEDLTPDESLSKYHFHFFDMDIQQGIDEHQQLKLLQLPSTFAPEDWSFTFYEGLSRYSPSEFVGKKMVELGCGNGWITLSLAKKYAPGKIYGFDINPRAILCSRLNLHINAINNEGKLVKNAQGKSLLDIVEFCESDLLQQCYVNGENDFDLIIGCIPQVLAPSSDLNLNQLHEEDDELLHSLSNYTTEQGYVEDQFGLGLIARSVEESIDLLKPNGKIILNLGERPGRNVLDRLFKRRGLLVRKVWGRKVEQADDTDIDSLVRLEKEMDHEFEFYTDLNSDTPINALLAKTYASAGGKIYHNLTVYEATIEFYTETRLLFDNLKSDLFAEAKSNLDLEYRDHNKKEEKTRFLAELVQRLNRTPYFPYEESQGEMQFRRSIAAFINAYHHTHLSHRHVLAAPNLASIIDNVISIYHPRSIFLPPNLFRRFDWLSEENRSFSIPECSSELQMLIEKVKPQIVVSKISASQPLSIEAIKGLIDTCSKAGTRLFLDISDNFELSSSPQAFAIFKYLSIHGIPEHVALICELSKNQVYSDLKTSFLITSNADLLSHLNNAAELSYSRTPFMSQLYYTIVLGELIGFHMPGRVRQKEVPKEESASFQDTFIRPADCVKEAFSHPAITGNLFPINMETVRLDYGENELNCPDDLKVSLLESYTQQHFKEGEHNPAPVIQEWLKRRFGISHFDRIHYGNGVAPLFSAIVKLIKKDQGTLVIPQGAYGYFYATAVYYNLPIAEIPTHVEDQFLITPKEVASTLKDIERPWLFVNFPLVNPTGAHFSDHRLKEILELPEMEKACIVLDTVFSGLEFGDIQKSSVLQEFSNKRNYILLGGISKEYSAGGIRFGFAASNFKNELGKHLLFSPHYTLLSAVKRLLAKYLENNPRIEKSLADQRQLLKERAQVLTETLTELGWKVLPPEGGLFLTASPSHLIGKPVKCSFSDDPVILNANNITQIFHDRLNLLINNEHWTGIPDYCRFVLSVQQEIFDEGLKRLKTFSTEFVPS